MALTLEALPVRLLRWVVGVDLVLGILSRLTPNICTATKDGAYRTAVRSDLRNLETAQEVFFVERSRYAMDLDTLYAVTNIRPSTGVTLSIVHADAERWSATGVYRNTDIQCRMAGGSKRFVDADASASPLCNGPKRR